MRGCSFEGKKCWVEAREYSQHYTHISTISMVSLRLYFDVYLAIWPPTFSDSICCLFSVEEI